MAIHLPISIDAYFASENAHEAEGVDRYFAVDAVVRDRLTHEPVTLLFAARDETRNNAVALKQWLDQRAG